MGYTFIDEDGFLGDGPSIHGLRELKEYLSTLDRDTPAMDMLLEYGETHLTRELAAECKLLAKSSTNQDVATTLKCLAKDAAKAKGIVIMTM